MMLMNGIHYYQAHHAMALFDGVHLAFQYQYKVCLESLLLHESRGTSTHVLNRYQYWLLLMLLHLAVIQVHSESPLALLTHLVPLL